MSNATGGLVFLSMKACKDIEIIDILALIVS